MKFASDPIVTQPFEQRIPLYQKLSTIEPRHRADGFAEMDFEGVVLAIGDERLVRLHHNGLAVTASNCSAIPAFQVEEVEAVLLRVSSTQVAMPVTIMPWAILAHCCRNPTGTW